MNKEIDHEARKSFATRESSGASAGTALGLPLLDVFARPAPGRPRPVGDFGLFIVHCNGVMQAHTGRGEPEMFWPRTPGPLTAASLAADLAAKRVDRRAGRPTPNAC